MYLEKHPENLGIMSVCSHIYMNRVNDYFPGHHKRHLELICVYTEFLS